MRKLYNSENGEGFVDFFLNDLSCLQKSINIILNTPIKTSIKQESLYYESDILFDITDFHL